MALKRVLLLTWVLIWIAEPFLALSGPAKASQQTVCSTCGMKDTCDEVCCCSHAKSMDPSCHQHIPGLYAAGCHPDHSNSDLFPQSLVKWFPTRQTFSPIFSSYRFVSSFDFIPTTKTEVLSPPPEAGFLS